MKKRQGIIIMGVGALLAFSLTLSSVSFAWISRNATIGENIAYSTTGLELSSSNLQVYKAFYPLYVGGYDYAVGQGGSLINYDATFAENYAESTNTNIQVNPDGAHDWEMNSYDPSYMVIHDLDSVSELNSNLVFAITFTYDYNAPIRVNLRVQQNTVELSAQQRRLLPYLDFTPMSYARSAGLSNQEGYLEDYPAYSIWRCTKEYAEGGDADVYSMEDGDFTQDQTSDLYHCDLYGEDGFVISFDTSESAATEHTVTLFINVDYNYEACSSEFNSSFGERFPLVSDYGFVLSVTEAN